MLNTHPYPSNGRFYGNGSCFVFRWINTTDSKQDQLKENSNSINEQDSTSLSVTSNKLMNIPVDVNSASISSSVLLVTDNHNSDLVSSSSSFDMRTETVTKEFAHLCYDDKREFPEQDKKQTFQVNQLIIMIMTVLIKIDILFISFVTKYSSLLCHKRNNT